MCRAPVQIFVSHEIMYWVAVINIFLHLFQGEGHGRGTIREVLVGAGGNAARVGYSFLQFTRMTHMAFS